MKPASECLATLSLSLVDMSPTDFKEFRRGVVNAILATDMAGHFEYVGKFQTRINSGVCWHLFSHSLDR